jgi:hypothetical protein
VPAGDKLTNFNLKFWPVQPTGMRRKSRTILCLDNYGNEIMSKKVHENLMNGLDIFDYLLGVDRKTGEVYCVSFLIDGEDLAVAFSPLVNAITIKVPKEYMKRLDELMSKKRPWFVSLPETALFAFVERFYGYNDLEKAVIVDLHFDELRLQVSMDGWREVSDWR